MKHLSSERGSAIMYVFIGVALFGALMFMFARGGSQNTSSLNGQQNAISASEIVERSRALEAAVQKLIGNGCSESEISFDIPPYTANPNPSAPTDKHCHVFHPSGAKLNASLFSDWIFSSNSYFPNVGTGAAILGAYIQGLDLSTCGKINSLLSNGLASPPSAVGTIFTATFDGTFNGTPNNLSIANGITAGCTDTDTHTPYVFFKALIIR